jgi:hypothetical protein
MLDPHDAERLLGAVRSNRALLFLGAGLSAGATNCAGNPIPNGGELARILWRYLEYDGDFDGTDLPTLFDAALKSPKGHAELRRVLETNLLCASVPSWYGSASTKTSAARSATPSARLSGESCCEGCWS